jgi:thymidylate synthase
MDITVGGEAEEEYEPGVGIGLQTHRASDNAPLGFPCLVHVDLTLYQGRLNMHATYRHQYLITKAYGNAVGLSQLLGFICHQTGRPAGELVIDATMADAEYKVWGEQAGVERILRRARAAKDAR